MTEAELNDRTKKFALRIMRLANNLPKPLTGRVIGNQLARRGTSVGDNHHSACRARSKAEFISRLGIVLEETNESEFWLELFIEGNLSKTESVSSRLRESHELTAYIHKFCEFRIQQKTNELLSCKFASD